MATRWLTLTTVNSPGAALALIAKGAQAARIGFVVAGDAQTPPDFHLEGCQYLSLAHQHRMFPRFCEVLPTRHYARKNVAYLAAMRGGAGVIQETDDDNIPRPSFFAELPDRFEAAVIKSSSPWFNVYSEYSTTEIWPRGLPLEYVRNSCSVKSRQARTVRGLIMQGMVDQDPDVDAVYRLVRPLPVSFREGSPIMLEPGTWCPFNSQNTVFRREVFPLLYLPSNCTLRVTDIWRSFVAQRCLWELGQGVLFHSATVWQERNEHNYLRDFEDEVPGYLLNDKIRLALDGLTLKSRDCRENLLACYDVLVQRGILPGEELRLVRAWCDEFDHF